MSAAGETEVLGGPTAVVGRSPALSAATRMDLRQLSYFVAVAEDLNFTHAARRLNVAQQSLSSAIARLESHLGFALFERSSRAVGLTDRGSRWLPHARELLAVAERCAAAARDIATDAAATLRIGLAATAAVEITPKLLQAFARRYPDVRLLTKHYGLEDPTGGLRGHTSDVAIVRPPFTGTGLDLIVVATEPRFVALGAGHPLANRQGVTFAEIAELPWIDVVGSDPVWCGFWRVSERRTRPPRFGAQGHTLDDLLDAARTGRAVGLVPASIASAQRWPGLAFVEVVDIAGSEVAIAWNSADLPAPARDFVDLAATLSDQPTLSDQLLR
ncbi:LysR family transcriptional regulator [Parafrankia colletiae]|uniref:LysR family transcriptional regulator n=1 Tax=Parafrankia colletiae TaxID=573497 RepID=A0A1S1R6U7_9ACTN|nr:LysR family transcriptional regulator [Parafrankia colletiae]MCK9905132.1 LysR family transcriptional regulator [Frankia sp. Cpl3]OHV41471.1 LysR family transcriptional regulator [Parafrankia colletiae]